MQVVALGFGLAFVALLSVQAPHWRPILASTWQASGANAAAAGAAARAGSTAGSSDGEADEAGWSILSALGVPFWAALGESSLDTIEQASPWVGQPLLWLYVMASQVLLVNLLIARLGNTYQKYDVNAEQEFGFHRVSTLLCARAYFAVPPPFSLPLLMCTPSAWCQPRGRAAGADGYEPSDFAADLGTRTVMGDPNLEGDPHLDGLEEENEKREVLAGLPRIASDRLW